MNVLEVKEYDVINGPGIRCSIWLSGCTNHCKGCWSPQTWDPKSGTPYKEIKKDIISKINNTKVKGISILGGDPFYNLFDEESSKELKDLLDICNNTSKPVWVWTGYTYEFLYKYYSDYLSYIDVLIDGPFIEELKDLNLYWRGSSNQRIIDVQESLKENKLIQLLWK